MRFWWLKEQEEQSRGSDRGRTGKESSPGKSESQRGTVAKSPGKPASFREELSSSPHRQSIKALEGLFGRQELGQRRIPFEVDIEVAGRSGPERVQERVVSNGAPSHAARPLTLNPSSVSLFLDTDEAEEAAGTGAAQSWCQAEQVREAELDKDPHSAGSADSPREFGGLLDGALEKLEALALACRLEDLKLTGGVNWAGDNNEKEAGIVTGGSYRGDDAWVEEADLTGGDAIQAEARKGKEAGLKTGENDRDNDAGIKETNLGIGQTKRGQNAEKEGRVFETGNFDQGEETGVKPPGAKTGGKRRVTAERRVQSRGGQTGTNRGETGGSRIQAGVQVPSAPVTAQKGTFMIGGEPNLTRRADLFQPTEQKMSTANVLRLDVTPQLSIPFADPNVKSDADSDADPEAVPQDLGVRVERSDEPARSESGSPGVAEAESSGRLKTAPGRQNDTESTERVLEMYVEKLKESTAFSLDVSSRLQNPADGSAGRDSEVSFASGELRGELDPLGTETDGRSEHTDASEPGIPPGSVQESVSVSVFALNLCGRAEMVSTRGFDRAAVDGQLKETAAPEEGEKPSAILESEKLAAALRIAETFTNPRLLPDEPLGALLGADSEGLRLDVDLERFGDFNEQEPDTVNAFEGASSVEDRGSLRGCEDEPARKALLGGEAEKAKGTEKSEMREKRIEIESRGQVEGGLKEGLRSRQESVTVERAEQTIEQTDTESEHRDSVKRMERELERDEPGLRLEVEKAEPTKQSLEDLAQLDWDSILSGDVDSCVRHLLDSPQCQRRSWASGEGADSRPISPPWKDRGRASASRGGADARPTSPPWKNKIMPEIPLLGGSLAGTQEAQSGGSGSRPQSPPQKDANPAIASGWGAISRPGSPLCRSQSLPTEFSSVGSPGAAWLEPGGGLHSLLGSPPWSVQNFPEVNLLVGSPGAARDAFRRWTVPGSPGVSGSAEPAGDYHKFDTCENLVLRSDPLKVTRTKTHESTTSLPSHPIPPH